MWVVQEGETEYYHAKGKCIQVLSNPRTQKYFSHRYLIQIVEIKYLVLLFNFIQNDKDLGLPNFPT